jgi:hypothetical protein
MAQIRYDSKRHTVGSFDTKQEAALAYDRAARQRGMDTLLNYDSIKAAEEAAAQAQTEHILVHPKQPKSRPSSGFYGVYARGKRWQVTIYYGSKNHNLGTFDTKQEAALAYDSEARQYGKDMPLNYESNKVAEDTAVQAQAEHILVHDMCAGPKQPKPRPPSGFYGVTASGKRWKAQIRYDGKTHHLSCFDTKQEAALVYDKAARQCEENMLLNYDSIKAAEEAAVQAQAEHILVHDMCAGPKQPKPRPPSGFYGVSANGKRWQAKIFYDSKDHYLGIFDTKQEAALAYDRKVRQCGKDKPLNYESIAAAEEAAAQAQAEIYADALCAGPKQPKPRPASGFYGVTANGKRWKTKIHASNGKRWQATICYDSKTHHLGIFDTKQQAALAYDRAARQCGKDKSLNYESIAAAEEAAANAQD